MRDEDKLIIQKTLKKIPRGDRKPLWLRFLAKLLRLSFILVIIAFLVALFGYIFMMTGKTEKADNINYGVTFSQLFAQQMDLDWQQAYLDILDELGVDHLRLVAYWPLIEKEEGVYDFEALDFQIEEAEKRDVQIILTMGYRVPRWPECHSPEWAKDFSKEKGQEEIRELLREITQRYKDSSAIWAWQVENEPFLDDFGICPDLDKDFLDEEIALVKSIDSNRPVILTTSGELSIWAWPAKRTKILGTTLYQTVYSDAFGYIHYPITPAFYHKRASFVKKFFDVDKVMVIELGTEPWGPKQIYETSPDLHFQSMNVNEFKRTVEYAQKTGLSDIYFWGVEWWYWLDKKYGEVGIWNEAKKLWAE